MILTGSAWISSAFADPKSDKADDALETEPTIINLNERPTPTDVVRLYDQYEREMEARLLSVTGEYVKIERVSDNEIFDLLIPTLSETSQGRIYRWIEKNPEVAGYRLDFDVKKRFVDSEEFETTGKTFKTSQFTYDIVLSNKSRNELRDAEVEYRIIYEDGVSFLRTTAYPGKGEQWEGDSADLPALEFNGRAEFSVPSITIESYEYVPRTGKKEFFSDSILGIWVRVVKEGVLIGEYRSNEASMANLVWDGEKKQGITFKDSFRESFDD